jgi:hypothetical protein
VCQGEHFGQQPTLKEKLMPRLSLDVTTEEQTFQHHINSSIKNTA